MALGKARALIGRPWVWVVVGLLALHYVLEVQGYRSLFNTPGDRFRALMNQFDKPDPGDTIERFKGTPAACLASRKSSNPSARPAMASLDGESSGRTTARWVSPEVS
jgi:hypothetical protein